MILASTDSGAPERSEVLWGSTRIPYAIRRSARRRTVSLSVDTQTGLLVTAPAATPVDRLDSVVRAKALWVVEHLRRKSHLPPPLPAREFVSGEGFSYLGRQLRLRLVQGAPPAPLALRGGWLELSVPSGLTPEQGSRYARAALVDWYRRRAEGRLPAEALRWARKLGVAAPRVEITEQEKRWGSCSRGIVRLNWRIVQAPQPVIEYVIAHEVVHLLHPDHGPAFWAALGRRMGDYESRKERLRQLGPALVW